MPDQPLAYLITYHTYGTWLHGSSPGSVDKQHNKYGTLLLFPDPERVRLGRDRMKQEPYFLDDRRRTIVGQAIIEECNFRGWELWALHVRANHVHFVTTASCDPSVDPSVIIRCSKAQATKRLNEAKIDAPGRQRWAEKGSKKYLWNVDAVLAAINYVLNKQGEPMYVYEGNSRTHFG